jgi:hypothetical protein
MPDSPARQALPGTIMIDCSKAEAAAIRQALPQTNVLYCHYHFWKAVNLQLNKKVSGDFIIFDTAIPRS